MAQEQQAVPVPIEPAMLVIKVDQFTDANNNKVIDAGESFAIRFTIENQGKGDAYNVRLRLAEQQGYDQYFDGPRELDGGNIAAGKSKEYTFRYIAKKELPTSLAKINIYAFEANGFDADPSELIVNTQEYAMPRLRVADHQFFASEGSSITLGKNGKLTVALQNFGTQTARKVKVNFTLPKNVYTTDTPEIIVDSIAPGDVAILDYGFLVNKRFDGDSIAVMLAVTESTRSASLNEAYKVKVGEYLSASASMNLSGNVAARKVNVKDFSLGFKSELMEDVPVGAVNRHRYALIIGNEDYSMTGANAEINVPYAVNDAVLFREYCAIGLSHSGWRGTVNRMGKATIEAMRREYGSRPEELRCAIGPSICQDCYEVSGDVAVEFEQAFAGHENEILIAKENGKYQLDLWKANEIVLLDAGVLPEHIEITDICTCCNPDLLFSHRASHGKRGNLGAFLCLK